MKTNRDAASWQNDVILKRECAFNNHRRKICSSLIAARLLLLSPEVQEFVTINGTVRGELRAHEQRQAPVLWHLAHLYDHLEVVPRALVVWQLVENLLQSLHCSFRRDRWRRFAIGEMESAKGKRRTEITFSNGNSDVTHGVKMYLLKSHLLPPPDTSKDCRTVIALGAVPKRQPTITLTKKKRFIHKPSRPRDEFVKENVCVYERFNLEKKIAFLFQSLLFQIHMDSRLTANKFIFVYKKDIRHNNAIKHQTITHS